MTIIILNGGAGTRLRPLSSNKVKSMVPFMGRPLQEHQIRKLQSCGFKNIIFSSCGRETEVSDYFSDGEEFNMRIKYYREKGWYHTAGTVKKIIAAFDSEVSDPFMVLYGDSLIYSADYKKMGEFHKNRRAQITILYHFPNFSSFLYDYHDHSFPHGAHRPRTNYGVIELQAEEHICYFEEKPFLEEIKPPKFFNPTANATVYVLNKEILELIPDDLSYDFSQDLFPEAIRCEKRCFGFSIGEEGYRIDIGTMPNYYQSQLAILRGEMDFDHYFPQQSHGVRVGARSRIDLNYVQKSVIAEDTTIGKNTCIQVSVIGRQVKIGKGCQVRNSIIHDAVSIGDEVTIENSILGEHSVIDGGKTLPGYTVMGNNFRIESNPTLFNQENFYGQIAKDYQKDFQRKNKTRTGRSVARIIASGR